VELERPNIGSEEAEKYGKVMSLLDFAKYVNEERLHLRTSSVDAVQEGYIAR